MTNSCIVSHQVWTKRTSVLAALFFAVYAVALPIHLRLNASKVPAQVLSDPPLLRSIFGYQTPQVSGWSADQQSRGLILNAGDLDGDRLPDFGIIAGREALLVSNKTNGEKKWPMFDALFTIYGTGVNTPQYVSRNIVGVGGIFAAPDVDGDGVNEIIAPFRNSYDDKPYNSGSRAMALYNLNLAKKGNNGRIAKFVDEDFPYADIFGTDVDAMTDLDGDGQNEVVIATQAASVMSIPVPGRVSVFTLTGKKLFHIMTTNATEKGNAPNKTYTVRMQDKFGSAVATGTIGNGALKREVIAVGASGYGILNDQTHESDLRGQVQVFDGKGTFLFKIDGKGEYDQLGIRVAIGHVADLPGNQIVATSCNGRVVDLLPYGQKAKTRSCKGAVRVYQPNDLGGADLVYEKEGTFDFAYIQARPGGPGTIYNGDGLGLGALKLGRIRDDDALESILVGAPFAPAGFNANGTPKGSNAGYVEVFRTDGSLDVVLNRPGNGYTGLDAAFIDVDGDGVQDIAVASPLYMKPARPMVKKGMLNIFSIKESVIQPAVSSLITVSQMSGPGDTPALSPIGCCSKKPTTLPPLTGNCRYIASQSSCADMNEYACEYLNSCEHPTPERCSLVNDTRICNGKPTIPCLYTTMVCAPAPSEKALEQPGME